MARNFTPFGIQFKGNGFYKTDNRRWYDNWSNRRSYKK
jgi:predicted nucleic acid-binding Zn ribbon protein